MVGSALLRLLEAKGYGSVVTRTSSELDLRNQADVLDFFRKEHIEYVILAAAKVGGIHANNTYPAEFIHDNLMIQGNVIDSAHKTGVGRLLFLGSSCIYPKFAAQPMKEECLLTGLLEPTNEPYAVAKIAGIKMCESYNRQYGTDYRAVMPTNLYGPQDNYHLENSHVIPAIMRKYHLARLAAENNSDAIAADERVFGPIPDDIKQCLGLFSQDTAAGSRRADENSVPFVHLWGSGTAMREFLHVDDMADACYHVMCLERSVYRGILSDYDQAIASSAPEFINIGSGEDCKIREVAEIIREIVGFTGETRYDSAQPDGTPRKLLDTSRIRSLGWSPQFSLQDGLRDAYRWYCAKM